MLKFFRCNKCGWQTVCSEPMARIAMKCGAVVQYIAADDPSIGERGPIQSIGLKPIGCGGELAEISEEEAMSHE